MSDWFTELSDKRRLWVKSTEDNNFTGGVRQSIVEKYADSVHFVYELLQNAEDQEATEAKFVLKSNGIWFSHNGSSFRQEDVISITGWGNSEKPQLGNKIGRYGVGFKSVFEVTDQPRIHTTIDGVPFDFVIEKTFIPVRIAATDVQRESNETVFWFPFREKLVETLYTEILVRLKTLTPDTMLFLNHLKTLKWESSEESGELSCRRNERKSFCLLSESRGSKGQEVKKPDIKYFVFSRTLSGLESERELSVSLAFRFERVWESRKRSSRLLPELGQETAFVFFPTREKTGLRFRLHAPFLLNDSRSNIKENDPVNRRLIAECADLFRECLPQLRDSGFMKAKDFEVMPLREKDFEGSMFKPLFVAFRDACLNQPLLPTVEGSPVTHVMSCQAKLSPSKPIRTLVTCDQLKYFYGLKSDAPVCWLSDALNSQGDANYFLKQSLKVLEFDASELSRKIDIAFMEAQSDSWVIEFYSYLKKWPAVWKDRGILRSKPFIRIENMINGKSHTHPFDLSGKPIVFLPSVSHQYLPTVKQCIAANGEAYQFFVDLGIKEPDIVDIAIKFVLPKYSEESLNIELEEYYEDIDTLAEAVTKCPPNKRSELATTIANAHLLKVESALGEKTALQSGRLSYRSTPTNRSWFKGNPEAWFLVDSPDKSKEIESIISMISEPALEKNDDEFYAKSIRINFIKPSSTGTVSISVKPGIHSRGMKGFDPNSSIDGLDFVLANMNPERSILLWRILLENTQLIRGEIEKATQDKYINSEKIIQYSLLGKACVENAWILDREGNWRKPCDIRFEMLPECYDSYSPHARDLAIKLGMHDPAEAEVLKKFGVSPERMYKLATIPSDEIDKFIESRKVREESKFPESATPYSARRAEKISEEARNAPEITYESREMSVRISKREVGIDAKAYLRQRYTNEHGIMVCQICEWGMHFKLANDDYFFESVECIKKTGKELEANHLALCPVCAAKYRYARMTSDESLRHEILNQERERCNLILANEPHTLRFVEVHRGDLQASLKAIDEESLAA